MRCIDCISWCLLFHFVWAAENSIIYVKANFPPSVSIPPSLSLSWSLCRSVIIQSSVGKLIRTLLLLLLLYGRKMTKLLQEALDKQEVPIAIDKSAFRIYTHKATRHTILRNMYLWIREGVGGGKGEELCPWVWHPLQANGKQSNSSARALAHKHLTYCHTHAHTHPPSSPSPCDCVRGVEKSKQAEKDNRANKTWAKNPRKSSGKLKFCQFFVGVNSTNRWEGVQGRDRDTQWDQDRDKGWRKRAAATKAKRASWIYDCWMPPSAAKGFVQSPLILAQRSKFRCF